jgi:hypothetical protein
MRVPLIDGQANFGSADGGGFSNGVIAFCPNADALESTESYACRMRVCTVRQVISTHRTSEVRGAGIAREAPGSILRGSLWPSLVLRVGYFFAVTPTNIRGMREHANLPVAPYRRWSVRPYRRCTHTTTNRASRTAVCPRLGRRLGMTSRQSSYGVRISVSPSSAISVLRRGMMSPPR